jgi:hypothetical protein
VDVNASWADINFFRLPGLVPFGGIPQILVLNTQSSLLFHILRSLASHSVRRSESIEPLFSNALYMP